MQPGEVRAARASICDAATGTVLKVPPRARHGLARGAAARNRTRARRELPGASTSWKPRPVAEAAFRRCALTQEFLYGRGRSRARGPGRRRLAAPARRISVDAPIATRRCRRFRSEELVSFCNDTCEDRLLTRAARKTYYSPPRCRPARSWHGSRNSRCSPAAGRRYSMRR